MKEIIFEYDDNESYDDMTKRAVHFLKTQTPKDNRIFLLQCVFVTLLPPLSKHIILYNDKINACLTNCQQYMSCVRVDIHDMRCLQ